jgi:hypothetical protein
MTVSVRGRFWAELALAVLSVAMLILTLVWKDWIEEVFGFEPDGGNGVVEWAIVAVLVGLTATTSVLARREWWRGHRPALE